MANSGERRKLQRLAKRLGLPLQEKTLPPRSTPANPPQRRLRIDSAKLVGILGLLVSLIIFRPKLSVTPSELLERTQPLSAPFHITSDSLLGLRDIKVICVINHLHAGKPGTPQIEMDSSTVRSDGWQGATLADGEQQTIICAPNDTLPLPVDADLMVVVDASLPYVPYSFRRYFRFVGTYGQTWQWLPQPSSLFHKSADATIAHADERKQKKLAQQQR